ncbi:hypothetical protein ACIBIZ_05845 [Nonomuraea spiralis]|uniref:hypothetical protein n=1 Tax=Nonomuraea TaxID=83681 RepID=UPI000F79353B|nr:hypothetical protein [Nonomuraea sp. WAC 01424]RSM95576.1 hypothetical protein DMB42_49410 [Nonomuraea sp. WAC 01424]
MFAAGVAALAAASTIAGGLPHGMLFLEKHPPAERWETYTVKNSMTLPLQLNPCLSRRQRDGGRLETRAVLYSNEDEMKYEQLVVYRDVRHAEAAMRLLRADLRRCADVGKGHNRYRYFTKPLDVGDDGLRAGGRFFESGEHAVAVRRGAALYIVGESAWPTRSLPLKGFKGLLGQARAMTVKVCRLPEAAC